MRKEWFSSRFCTDFYCTLIDLGSIFYGPGKEDSSFIFSVSTLTITKYNKY